ncbi:MAG: hypothetical protein LBU42_03290 [Prevotellaceae bacterium]|jgi:hypothetical protein|nr:hypothetical protein [Prevotellaceae bacterium]
MKNTDKIKSLTGTLHLCAYNARGEALWHTTEHNLIVLSGYQSVVEALAGVEGARIANIAVGTNGEAPVLNDAGITNAVAVPITRVTYPEFATARFHFKIGYNDANGLAIREYGLLTAAGKLFSRKVREPLEKTQYLSIVGMWDIKLFEQSVEASPYLAVTPELVWLPLNDPVAQVNVTSNTDWVIE